MALIELLAQQQLPAYLAQHHRYLITIDVGPKVWGHVMREKTLLRRHFENDSLFSKPHLTVGAALMQRYNEECFCRALRKVCKNLPSTTFFINGCDAWVNKKTTVYSRSSGIDFLRVLHHRLRAALRSSRISGLQWRPCYTPHITIIKDLPDFHFGHCWSLLDKWNFQADFIAADIVVFRRDTDSNRCTEIDRISLDDGAGQLPGFTQAVQQRLFE